MLAAGVRENLRIDKARIQGSVDARDVFANEGFEPALRLCAV